MKKVNTSLSVLAAVALFSTLLLGGCGNQKASTATSPSSSQKTVQTSSSSSNSSNKKALKKTQASSSTKQEESSVATESSDMVAANSASVPETTVQTEQATTPDQGQGAVATQEDASQAALSSSVDTASLAQADFSSIAGTWQDEQGNVMTIGTDGKLADGRFLYTNTVNGEIYMASLGTKEGASSGFFIIPAGASFPAAMDPDGVVAVDNNHDRIMVGQDLNALYHPFYRVN